MAFRTPLLPHAHDALAASGMSKETLEFHHDIHHKAYVDNGNKLIAGTEWDGKSLEDIVRGPTSPAPSRSRHLQQCLAALEPPSSGPALALGPEDPGRSKRR